MDSMEYFRHSISLAKSRSAAESKFMDIALATWPISLALDSRIDGAGTPTSCGQKYSSCESAAAWKVLTETVPTPSCLRRERNSPAARFV